MTNILTNKCLKNKIISILNLISISFEKSNVNFVIAENGEITPLITIGHQLNDKDLQHIDSSEIKIFNIAAAGVEEKYIAAAKLSTITGDLVTAYFMLSKNDHSRFSDREIDLLSGFVALIEQTVADHQKQAELLDVVNDFVHKAVHDLKNPLTSISLSTELLKRKADDPATIMKFADKLQNASKRLFDGLDHLKSAFPKEDRSFKLAISSVNLTALLNQSTPNKNLQLISDHEEIIVYADAHRLAQAFDSLITIADADSKLSLKTEEGQVKISLEHHGSHHFEQANFLIAKMLLEMHKGNIEVTEDRYYISLPFEMP
jgi:signal transduction histidine kinase